MPISRLTSALGCHSHLEFNHLAHVPSLYALPWLIFRFSYRFNVRTRLHLPGVWTRADRQQVNIKNIPEFTIIGTPRCT